jgi:methionyl-tRNA formyltransferase
MTSRLVFAGSPAVAVPYLDALVAAGFDVVSVISRAPSPRGRKRELTQTPVAVAATRHGIPVIETNSLRDVSLPECDLAVVVAYGGLVPANLLDSPKHGWINVHFSVLPAYRGAAPIQRSIFNGDATGGISIFRLVTELDAGPVLFSRAIAYEPNETATEALARFASETTDELVGTIRLLKTGGLHAVDQVGEPTFASKFTREDGRVDWSLPAATIAARIRGVTDEPGAFTTLDEQSFGIVRVLPRDGSAGAPGEVSLVDGAVLVGAGDGSIELVMVKPAGKALMAAADWFRGRRGEVHFE